MNALPLEDVFQMGFMHFLPYGEEEPLMDMETYREYAGKNKKNKKSKSSKKSSRSRSRSRSKSKKSGSKSSKKSSRSRSRSRSKSKKSGSSSRKPSSRPSSSSRKPSSSSRKPSSSSRKPSSSSRKPNNSSRKPSSSSRKPSSSSRKPSSSRKSSNKPKPGSKNCNGGMYWNKWQNKCLCPAAKPNFKNGRCTSSSGNKPPSNKDTPSSNLSSDPCTAQAQRECEGKSGAQRGYCIGIVKKRCRGKSTSSSTPSSSSRPISSTPSSSNLSSDPCTAQAQKECAGKSGAQRGYCIGIVKKRCQRE